MAWDFRCTGAERCDGRWASVPVPGNWELHGFGAYRYGHDRADPPERGEYRRSFTVPPSWQERRVFLVFEGAMTDAVARLGGRPLGPPHRGGFYPFRYEVGALLDFGGPNRLEVTVEEVSADDSVNAAERRGDYWVFGGLHRPVYLEAHPRAFLAGVAVDARHDGRWTARVEVDAAPAGAVVTGQVRDGAGRRLGQAARARVADGIAPLAGVATGAAAWSAETPVLHDLELVLAGPDGRPLHRRRLAIGFRTVELRAGDGLFLNGRRIRLAGVNRHSFWPDAGRATSVAVSRLDAALIRGMNLDAVRTAHYPPDEHFLAECDRQGLYVLDELAGWHRAYSTAAGAPLVEAMIRRDRNHPSVIAWANGNEDGWNLRLDPLFHRFDPQRRPLLHPRADFGGVATRHYPSYGELAAALALDDPAIPLAERFRAAIARRLGGSRLVLPTEMLHGLYDGGGAAGLGDWLALMRRSSRALGGFLWALFDEAVVRTDRGGALDVHGADAPDGILGPYRQPEGSASAIRELLSPVEVDAPPPGDPLGDDFTGRLRLVNRFDFLDLAACRLSWQLWRFPGPLAGEAGHRVVAAGELAGPAAPPGASAETRVPLPLDWRGADALRVAVITPDGREVADFRWPLRDRRAAAHRWLAARQGAAAAAPVAVRSAGGRLILGADTLEASFDSLSGALVEARAGSWRLPLAGPRLLGPPSSPLASRHRREGAAGVVETAHRGGLLFTRWRLRPDGWLRLAWQLDLQGERDAFGLGFDLPRTAVAGVRFLGGGPFRIWANRGAGALLDAWEKARNETVTGRSWDYPEFAGFHAPPYWVCLEVGGGRLVIVAADPVYLQLLRPPAWPESRGATAPFPAADLGLLHAIPPIGSKFHRAVELGPSGRRTRAAGSYRGEIYLRFVPPAGAAQGGG